MKALFMLFCATQIVAQTSDKTLILVSGAGHGAWAWEKVIPLLKDSGYRVIAIDLPGSGKDSVKVENNTLKDDVDAVISVAKGVAGKVILLGHSSGGIVISQAAEKLGKQKVDKLIYLDAFLPEDGESVSTIAKKVSEYGHKPHNHDTVAQDRMIFSKDKRRFMWNPKIVGQLFYDDCSAEDVAFAKAHLTWQSTATLATAVHLTEKGFGAIDKYYILCTKAKDLDKSSLTSRVSPEKIYKLPSSHSPFFSKPAQLVAILKMLY